MNMEVALNTPVPSPDTSLSALDTLRRRGIRAWAAIGWISLGLLLLGNFVLGARSGLALLTIGTIINIGPTIVALQGRYDASARTMTGSLAAIIPVMLIFLLRGHPWQMDAHMYFFVGLAALVMLADWRPIAFATILTAIFHVLLEIVAPYWIFSGSGSNGGRVVFHVVAVALQFGALTFLTIQLERLFTSQDDSVHRSNQLAEAAEQGRRATERAMNLARAAEAEAAKERRERAEQTARLEAERRGELGVLANEFKRSVTSVVGTIGQASDRLEQAAVQLEEIAGVTTRDADEVASGVGQANTDITQVASSIRDLSQSIRTIAIAAEQQSALTDIATTEAKRSVETVAMLEEHAIQIETFLNDIRRIAAKTNLLALNATIEAARAGDAGRSFAIVAGEVKMLSSDTRKASDRISALILGIRDGVADTGVKLRSVSSAIAQVAEAASGIAGAVGEQRSTANLVDVGAERAAQAADDIEYRIGGVAKAAGATSALSMSVRNSATDLASSARALRSSTDLFVSFLQTNDVRAA